MSTEAALPAAALSPEQQLCYAEEIIRLEAQALDRLARRLDGEFCRAAQLVFQCRGSVVVTGIGKAGLIGQKVAATLASTGNRSHFLHPVEAVHGDLGRIHRDDVVLAMSKSGETEELLRLVPSLVRLRVPIIAVTASAASSLGRAAAVSLELGPLQEACSLGLAPSTSTTAMLAMGDALALVASRMRGFRREDFYVFHPAGSLGQQLSRVEDRMRTAGECRIAADRLTVRQVFVELSRPGRRSGAIMLTGDNGALSGLFTDSDLARLFESRRDGALDGPIREVMTVGPRTVQRGAMLADAIEIMAERKISELPVVNAACEPVGLLDITDVVSLLPSGVLPGQADPPHAVKAPKHLRSPPANPALWERP